jgi:RimJ/RimL family protein N-acetyltransferase
MALETQRLILDTWQSADWTAFRPIATDVEVVRYITGGVPWSDDRIRSFVDRQIELYRTRGFCRWKLLQKPAGNLIGFCGVGIWRDGLEPEIGWWLARAYWGRGLASEAAAEALDDAFERAGLERVVSIAMSENRASIRIMEKLGLEFDGEFESEGVRLVRHAMDRVRYREIGRHPAGSRRSAQVS